jgi:hypothetical protein
MKFTLATLIAKEFNSLNLVGPQAAFSALAGVVVTPCILPVA